MRILAFDLGRTTGWAVLEDGELETGSFTAKGDDEAEVFIDWWRRACLLVVAEHPDAVAFEDVTFNRGRSHIPGMKALLFVITTKYDLTAFGVPVQTLKAFAKFWSPSGKWTGSKSNMQYALWNRIANRGPRSNAIPLKMDENEVDAAWIAIWFDETAIEGPPEAIRK